MGWASVAATGACVSMWFEAEAGRKIGQAVAVQGKQTTTQQTADDGRGEVRAERQGGEHASRVSYAMRAGAQCGLVLRADRVS
jgi:hypothetical protein